MEPPTGAVAPAAEVAGDGSRAAPVPVTVLTGFLGAGKTTLLNRILAGSHGLRIAAVVNDFGAVNIDSRLVVSRDATMISLDNGCICCSMAGDLVTQLTRLLEMDAAPEHVVIETSGVSDPGRILVALRDRHLRDLARIDGVVTLVDAAGAFDIPAGHQELARRQLAAADMIVVNKADLVSGEVLAALRERLSYPRARICDAVDADVPLEVVLGIRRDDAGAGAGDQPDAHPTERLATWSWSSRLPLEYRKVRDVLLTLPVAVYRAKGFVYLAEAPQARVIAHVVGRRVDLRPSGDWEGDAPATELVFISLDGAIDTVSLRRRLASATARAAGYGMRANDTN